MKTATIYRVEHRNLKKDKIFAGPYMTSYTRVEDWCDDTCLHADSSHPEPFADPKLSQSERFSNMRTFFCGFESLRSLRKWFSKDDLKNLEELGFAIYKYEAKEFVHGTFQSVFVPLKDHDRKEVRLRKKSRS